MARAIVWSLDALDDLEAIAEYIARDSRASASKMISKILAAAQVLDMFPNLGLVVPEYSDPALRQCIVLRYRLIYRIEADQITVLNIIHTKRRSKNRL